MERIKTQTIIFDKTKFPSRKLVKNWIIGHNFKLCKYKKQPIESKDNTWRVRQRDPKYFNKYSFKTKELRKGIKIIIGRLKQLLINNDNMYSNIAIGIGIMSACAIKLFENWKTWYNGKD